MPLHKPQAVLQKLGQERTVVDGILLFHQLMGRRIYLPELFLGRHSRNVRLFVARIYHVL